MKRAVLIVNPFASHVTEERITAVERALMRAAYVRTVRTERPRHAVELARESTDADALIVFSGDGGFNEALNGIERDDLPLGFVPAAVRASSREHWVCREIPSTPRGRSQRRSPRAGCGASPRGA